MILFLLLAALALSSSSLCNPHFLWNQTWMIVNKDSTIANSTSSAQNSKDTWFLDLFVDFCDQARERWDPSDLEPFSGCGCKTPGWWRSTRSLGFYVCPGHSHSKEQQHIFQGAGDDYCAEWLCESTRWILSPCHLLSMETYLLSNRQVI